jgi:hypothetical protein
MLITIGVQYKVFAFVSLIVFSEIYIDIKKAGYLPARNYFNTINPAKAIASTSG